MMGGGTGIFSMIFGLIFFFLLTVGAIILVVWLVRYMPGGGMSAPPSRGNALEILQMRYAKGEISKEEYAEMKKELAA